MSQTIRSAGVQTAIVTGGSSGIGRACVEHLTSAGVRCLTTARRVEALDELRRSCPDIIAMPGDLTDDGAVEAVFAQAKRAFGKVDLVVNNAGYMTSGPIESINLDKVSQMIRLNVDVAFRVMYLAVRHFRENDRGHLVNISSTLGRRVVSECGAYAGTKHAVEALSQGLRMEVARSNIRITNLLPGLVETDLHREYAVPFTQVRNISKPLTPADIAASMMFALAQPDHVRIEDITVTPSAAS